MKILCNWKIVVTIFLVLIALMAYTSTAMESPIPATEKACCNTESGCPLEKKAAPNSTGGSIIWDSMADNLLSAHI